MDKRFIDRDQIFASSLVLNRRQLLTVTAAAILAAVMVLVATACA
jgi:hypothetical protein